MVMAGLSKTAENLSHGADGPSLRSGFGEVCSTSGNSTSRQRDHSSVKSLPCHPPHCDSRQVNYSRKSCFFGVTRWGFQYEDAEVELACRHFLGVDACRHSKWSNQGLAEGEEDKLQQSLGSPVGKSRARVLNQTGPCWPGWPGLHTPAYAISV